MDYETLRERAAMFRGQISLSAEFCLKVYEQMEERGFNLSLGAFVDENSVPVRSSNKEGDKPSAKLDSEKLVGQITEHAEVSNHSNSAQINEKVNVEENVEENNKSSDHIETKIDEELFNSGPFDDQEDIYNSGNQWFNPTTGIMHFFPPGAKAPVSKKAKDDPELTKMQIYFKNQLSNSIFVQRLDQYFIEQKHSGDFKLLKNGVKGALMYALFNCVCEGPIKLNAKFRYYDYSGYIKNLFTDSNFLNDKKWRKHVLAMKKIMLQCGINIKESKMLNTYGEYYPSFNFYDPPTREQF
ncbi:hypothetical protein CANINC_001071 [Pichia inconspicua]|uniref:Uncharacterized protein n=1 Tax=Pichia inconspicua TaxID=52247 RepID=A0A4T0X4N4_9ASCO|nr:hypothetical protein CANINC_001071 [[Candida] inconspicua]